MNYAHPFVPFSMFGEAFVALFATNRQEAWPAVHTLKGLTSQQGVKDIGVGTFQVLAAKGGKESLRPYPNGKKVKYGDLGVKLQRQRIVVDRSLWAATMADMSLGWDGSSSRTMPDSKVASIHRNPIDVFTAVIEKEGVITPVSDPLIRSVSCWAAWPFLDDAEIELPTPWPDLKSPYVDINSPILDLTGKPQKFGRRVVFTHIGKDKRVVAVLLPYQDPEKGSIRAGSVLFVDALRPSFSQWFADSKKRPMEKIRCVKNVPNGVLNLSLFSPDDDVIYIIDEKGAVQLTADNLFCDGVAIPRVGGLTITAKSADEKVAGVKFYSRKSSGQNAPVPAAQATKVVVPAAGVVEQSNPSSGSGATATDASQGKTPTETMPLETLAGAAEGTTPTEKMPVETLAGAAEGTTPTETNPVAAEGTTPTQKKPGTKPPRKSRAKAAAKPLDPVIASATGEPDASSPDETPPANASVTPSTEPADASAT